MPTSAEANVTDNAAVNTVSSTEAHTARRSDVWDHFTGMLDDRNFTHGCVHYPMNHNELKLYHDKNGSGSYSNTRPLNYLKKRHADFWITIKSGKKSADKEKNVKNIILSKLVEHYATDGTEAQLGDKDE